MSVRVVVIGGGYAGLMAANRLAASARGAELDVTVLSREDRFVERIRLHEYAAGSRTDATQPYDQVLHPAACIRVGTVERIDAGARTVLLDGDATLRYDYLVYAAGSGAACAGTGGYSLSDRADAERTRSAVGALPSGSVVAVVGGGLTAIEAVTELAEQHPALQLLLVTAGEIGPSLSPSSRGRIRRRLRRLGVDVREGVAVPATGDPRVSLGADLVLWCAGFTAPSLAADSGLPVTDDGRLRVDATLAADADGRIFGVGDGAVIDAPGYSYHRRSCASAMPMGAHAADNILGLLDGRRPAPISTGFVAQCLSLGRRDALIQFVSPDDRPRRLHLAGGLGVVAKEAICRQTLRWLRGEARRGGSYSWPGGPTESAPRGVKETAWS